MKEKIYTIDEVAEMLQVSVQAAGRELRKGKLEGFKSCGKWRVTQRAFDEYIGGTK
jgi:excisionase family DNA binding protein